MLLVNIHTLENTFQTGFLRYNLYCMNQMKVKHMVSLKQWYSQENIFVNPEVSCSWLQATTALLFVIIELICFLNFAQMGSYSVLFYVKIIVVSMILKFFSHLCVVVYSILSGTVFYGHPECSVHRHQDYFQFFTIGNKTIYFDN